MLERLSPAGILIGAGITLGAVMARPAVRPQPLTLQDNGRAMDEQDIAFMQEAIRVACEKGSDPARSPIGCVIVINGSIVAARRNQVVEKHDAVAHAEIEAIRAAGQAFEKGELRGATLYSTLQPCGMCTMASIWSKVRRIVYGAGREDVHEMYFEARHVDTLQFVQNAYRDDLDINGGVLRDACSRLYYRPWDQVPVDQQGNK